VIQKIIGYTNKYVFAILAFAITFCVAIFVLPWLHWRCFSGNHIDEFYVDVSIIVAFVLASAAFACTCIFWKNLDSLENYAIVRGISNVIAWTGMILLVIVVIGVASQNWIIAVLVFSFVWVFLVAGALPWTNATEKQCAILFLKSLGAYVPLILSICLMFALIPFTKHSDYEIVTMLPSILFLIGLCTTLCLLCLIGITLCRYFKSVFSKVAELLLFSVAQCIALFILLGVVFVVGFALTESAGHQFRIPEPFEAETPLDTEPIIETIPSDGEGVMMRTPYGKYEPNTRSKDIVKRKIWHDCSARIVAIHQLACPLKYAEEVREIDGKQQGFKKRAGSVTVEILPDQPLPAGAQQNAMFTPSAFHLRDQFWTERETLIGKVVDFEFLPGGNVGRMGRIFRLREDIEPLGVRGLGL
jgi:hypothetical protein